jgi:predicted ATPase
MLLDHARRCSLPLWSALGSRFQSVVDIKGGDLDTGLRLSRTVLDEIAKPDVRLRFFIGLGELAEALGHAGQISDGLAVIEEALAWVESGERWAISEVLRIKGELVLLQGAAGAAAAAEDHFRQALDWARRQDALSWELRAATSLARLMGDHGRSAEATALLQPVYARFTEGFDTTDLKAAKALLEALAGPNALRTRIS